VRQRLRDLGYTVGRFPIGERNALVDVPGVLVGHATLADGAARTGVTAILPHDGNLYADKVLGACHAINAYGKPAGLSQLQEMGTIESPILITGTLSVGPVWEGGLRHVLERNPQAARDRDTVNVIVGECFDGWLSDARALTVRAEHALEAIASAGADDAREGSVGAGTGTTCFGFKSGVGTSSRRVEDLRLGCLVVSNYGGRRDLHMLTRNRRAHVGSPTAPARDARRARARPRRQLRLKRQRRVRDRILDGAPGPTPDRRLSPGVPFPPRRLAGRAAAVRGRG
jgi:D-aminopeptidase